jgi:hypothetical protein
VALKYEVVTGNRAGRERVRRYASREELEPGDVIILLGRHWLIERVDQDGEGIFGRAIAKAARYRMRLRYPDGHEEIGAFRRYRPHGPRLGHSFTTSENGHPISWEVVREEFAFDEQGEPYLDLVAERDYAELEQDIPAHELEHLFARRGWEVPEGAAATIARAAQAGLAVELVSLEAGDEPDWEEAQVYIDALILEELGDDLIEQCGVDPENDPRETWLDTAKARLGEDLHRFRDDVEGDHDEIEEWEFQGGRVLASVGTREDESEPIKGHGWMCRLLDASALGAAGFKRVRKVELVPE